MTTPLVARAVFCTFTLYMMVLLVRWLGPYLEIDLFGRLRWVRGITDPLLNLVRRVMPPLGPVDFAPVVALLLVWLARQVTLAAFTFPV